MKILRSKINHNYSFFIIHYSLFILFFSPLRRLSAPPLPKGEAFVNLAPNDGQTCKIMNFTVGRGLAPAVFLTNKPCSCHPERRKSHGVRFSKSNPTQGRARSGIYNGISLCSVCLAQSNQSLPFKGGGIAKQ